MALELRDFKHQYRVTFFKDATDNKVRGRNLTWDEIVALLRKPHAVIPDKTKGKAFSGVRYLPLEDLKLLGKDRVVKNPNGTRFYPRRLNVNVQDYELLILDFDSGLTIEDAKERFKKYTYIGYTTFSHRANPNVDKFRLVFPWKQPVSAHQGKGYDDTLKLGIQEFGGPFDKKCLDPGRLFFLPAVHPGRLGTEVSWSNQGALLNPDDLRRPKSGVRLTSNTRLSVSDPKPSNSKGKKSSQTIHPDDLIELKDGRSIRAGDVTNKIEGVKCPFHDDKKGTEFIKRVPESGNIFLYCRHCDKSYYVEKTETHKPTSLRPPVDEIPPTPTKKKIPPIKIEEFFPGFEYSAPNREKVKKELESVGRQILSSENKFHIIYSPEGAGKSALAMSLARGGSRIIFACQSWDQVAEKYEDFKEKLKPYDVPVSIAFSKEGRIRKRFNVKVVREETKEPFKPGEINIGATFIEIQKKHPHISKKYFDLFMSMFSEDKYRIINTIRNTTRGLATLPELNEEINLNFESPDIEDESSFDVDEMYSQKFDGKHRGAIVLTTFALVRIIKDKRDRIPLNWIVWFDDPGIEDVTDIDPIEDIDEETTDEELSAVDEIRESIQGGKNKQPTRKIEGVTYAVRKRSQSLGRSVFRHNCVFTTTEKLTLRALRKNLTIPLRPLPKVYDTMTKLDSGGKLTILGTQYVRRRYDAMIPLIVRKLEKQKIKVALIADGLGSKYNHTNSKGLNTLINTNTIVEISIPHPYRVRSLCHLLGLLYDPKDQSIANDLMLDQLHQAIGRNVGFRGNGFECVVLIDRSRHKELLEGCRYSFDPKTSVMIDRKKSMGRTERRLGSPASKLTKEIETLLNRFDDLATDRRTIIPLINHVLKGVENDSKRLLLVSRLLATLTSLSGVKFDSEVDSSGPADFRSARYRELGNLILKEWVAKPNLPGVISQYLEILQEPAN